jgi:hypothetical protein
MYNTQQQMEDSTEPKPYWYTNDNKVEEVLQMMNNRYSKAYNTSIQMTLMWKRMVRIKAIVNLMMLS